MVSPYGGGGTGPPAPNILWLPVGVPHNDGMATDSQLGAQAEF